MSEVIIWILVIGFAVLAVWLYFKFFKLYKIKNIVFIDGSLGTGKSYYSVALAVRLYKRQLFRYKFKGFILPLLSFLPKCKEALESLEEPILYSNINLRNIKFAKLNVDLLFRRQRFSYGSVILIDEFSLLADQMLWKDREMSERLSIFWKLLRHELRGGFAVVNSQSTSDLHYSLKYVLSDYLYIHHRTKFPFVTALKVQEMVYTADKDGGGVINARNEDIEETCKTILCFNRYYKYYDSYCYSVFTDCCPVYKITDFKGKGANLKDQHLVSFKTYKYLTENLEASKND